ncbi:MAG: hypothetical protein QNI99_17525 [Woeseiaceae bacterium]|nr:hypothetical protein [Woeseiaceae bacterium]
MERRILIAVCVLALSGCASYTTPGGPVSMAGIDDATIEEAYLRQPASGFPANIAMIRIQDAGYSTRTAFGHRVGAWSVVTTRDIESEDAIERIASLPLIDGVAPVGRLLLPQDARGMKDLRRSAAQLRADMLLVYSVDTQYTVEGQTFGPFTAISLGMLPNRKAHVTSTVSGLLIDVRTGFIYGSSESTATEQQRSGAWTTAAAADEARIRSEAQAFEDFVDEFATLWSGVAANHASRPAMVPSARDGWHYDQRD